MTTADLRYNYVFIGYDEYYLFMLGSLIDSDFVLINNRPWNNYRGLKRLICKAHFSYILNSICRIPFKSIWARSIIFASFKNDKPICFILHGSSHLVYVKNVIPLIRKMYPSAKVIFHCTDTIKFYVSAFGKKRVSNMIKSVDHIITYNKEDSRKYGFEIIPPVVPNYSNFQNRAPFQESDLLFIGRSKGREQLLHSIYKSAQSYGLKCDFTILGVPFDKRLSNSDINYERYIPYRDVIDKINATKCILNIPQDGFSGTSLRDYEAFGNNKYLLTNNRSILLEECANRESIILFDELDDIDYGKIFEPINSNYCNKWTWLNRLFWFENSLFKRSINK